MDLLHLLQSNSAAFCLLITTTGLAVGSFLNVVIYRLPKMLHTAWRKECCEFLELDDLPVNGEQPLNLVTPRSRCPHCGHGIRVRENIPVLSYLFLRGRCSACRASISVRYPAVELLCGLLSLIVAWHFGYSLQVIPALVLTWSLTALCFIDIDHHLLPDDITLPILWLGILCNIFGLFTDIFSSVLGAMAGYLSLWLIYILFKVITGKEGMGHGDFKLLALLGAWMGWELLPLIIILSSLCGAVVGTAMILFAGHDRRQAIPFGPYLAMAGWIAFIWGTQIMTAYNNWLMVT